MHFLFPRSQQFSARVSTDRESSAKYNNKNSCKKTSRAFIKCLCERRIVLDSQYRSDKLKGISTDLEQILRYLHDGHGLRQRTRALIGQDRKPEQQKKRSERQLSLP